MRPFLQRLAKVAECFVHVYSNAGLPNAMGGYDDTPEDMARDNLLFAEEGLINMLGGCCGSTPAHIKARSRTHVTHEWEDRGKCWTPKGEEKEEKRKEEHASCIGGSTF